MPKAPTFTASLSQSQEREGWSVIFRHPRKPDATGRLGRRVRRGLRTKDPERASELVRQLNELLADPGYWEVSAQATAINRFDPLVAQIFYDELPSVTVDPFRLRDRIELPSSAQGEYRRVLLQGTTGGGKTTLVRQLTGTHPTKERFPSVSTAKTTVADMELVLDDGPYRAVVTFAQRDEVRDNVEDNASAAVLAAYRGASPLEVMRRLMNHVNQRFRLQYILGNGPLDISSPAEDDESEEYNDEDSDSLSFEDWQTLDLEQTNSILAQTLQELQDTSQRLGHSLRAELNASDEDERVVEEIFEENLDHLLRDDEQFQNVVDSLMEEIERRFALLTDGDLEKTTQGWPKMWHWTTTDRHAFIRAVNRFSSNYAPFFGTLLTPVVNGIRVAGPFSPKWPQTRPPRLVLFDGEGLGHTPDSAASLPTATTRRIEEVDAVLLVDASTQPMQAAPVAVMRNLVSSGKSSKLLICFTQFDKVKGDNLPSFSSKQQHVLASAENALTSLGEQLGPFAERALRKRLQHACFFVGDLDKTLDESTVRGKRTIQQLRCLLTAIDAVVERPAPVPSKPSYDRMNLVLAVKKATEDFHATWAARLGRQFRVGVAKEHWTRVKALSRRLAVGWSDEYDTLRPIADLHRDLKEQIYVFIQSPMEWSDGAPGDDEKQQIFDEFAEAMSARVLDIVARRLRLEKLVDWQRAFVRSGRGSSFERAAIISDDIYSAGAPIPDVTPSPKRNEYLHEVVMAIDEAAKQCEIELR